MERALVLCRGTQIEESDLPKEIRATSRHQSGDLTLSSQLAETERRCITEALAKTGGNRNETASLLGISRKNLWEKMKFFDLLD